MSHALPPSHPTRTLTPAAPPGPGPDPRIPVGPRPPRVPVQPGAAEAPGESPHRPLPGHPDALGPGGPGGPHDTGAGGDGTGGAGGSGGHGDGPAPGGHPVPPAGSRRRLLGTVITWLLLLAGPAMMIGGGLLASQAIRGERESLERAEAYAKVPRCESKALATPACRLPVWVTVTEVGPPNNGHGRHRIEFLHPEATLSADAERSPSVYLKPGDKIRIERWDRRTAAIETRGTWYFLEDLNKPSRDSLAWTMAFGLAVATLGLAVLEGAIGHARGHGPAHPARRRTIRLAWATAPVTVATIGAAALIARLSGSPESILLSWALVSTAAIALALAPSPRRLLTRARARSRR
ncbi:hypothetical protein ACN20G_09845 [Streptomyces sp. BI20]|uniref:hypothetical protein n=1 Tax=Streptomyces sp. BI20 TaxID=3403460 RepID=UPI003C723855